MSIFINEKQKIIILYTAKNKLGMTSKPVFRLTYQFYNIEALYNKENV